MNKSSNRQLKFSEALNEAVDLCLENDERVILLGLGVPDPTGVFGTTTGLADKYGPDRVLDMPVSENAMTGIVLGASLVGLRPVMTHMRVEFAMTAMDQIYNQAAKWHYMFGGQSKVPLVLRMIVGRGWGQGPQHSQSLHSWFAHIPGLTVVAPSTPHDAKGLLISSIEYDGPVLFFEHRWLYNIHGPVPEGMYRVPLGQPQLLRQGKDVTIVGLSYTSLEAMKAANRLSEQGIDAEVLDLRTLNPLDDTMILESVAKTGHLIVADQSHLTCGYAAEIVSRVAEKTFDKLKSPPVRIALPDCPTPTTRALSNFYYPTVGHIEMAAKKMMGHAVEDPYDGINPEDKLDVPDPSFTGPF